MANHVELAQAYITLIPTTQGAESKIAEELVGAVASPAEEAGAAAGAGMVAQMLGAMGIQLPAGVAAVGVEAGAAGGVGILSGIAAALTPAAIAVAVAAIGKVLFDIGEEYDQAFDYIITGTGATGEALDDLEQVALNVYGSTVGSLQDTAEAVADLNTRTGATGDTLGYLATQFLQLDEIGFSADINEVTGAFNQWGFAAEDMGGYLDEMFFVAQATGVSMDTLASAAGTNAAMMQQLGFSFEDVIAMTGLMDKAGMDASSMFGQLGKACVAMAKDGEQPAETYARVTGEIDELLAAGDEAAALDLASQLFGTRGAMQYIQACEAGTMSTEELTDSMAESQGIISENAENTRSFAENADLLKSRISNLLEPLGSAVFEAAGDALGVILDIMDELNPLFEELSPAVSFVADILGGAFQLAIEGVIGAIQTATDAVRFFKDLFTGELEFPHIKVPHIHVDGGEIPWGIGGLGTKPEITIDWYKTGGIATGASLVGIGEAGNEAIVPLQGKYMQPFAEAVAEDMGNGELLQEVRALREDVRNLKIYLDSGELVGGIARKMDTRLANYARQGVR